MNFPHSIYIQNNMEMQNNIVTLLAPTPPTLSAIGPVYIVVVRHTIIGFGLAYLKDLCVNSSGAQFIAGQLVKNLPPQQSIIQIFREAEAGGERPIFSFTI